jgi:hypothetical protein
MGLGLRRADLCCRRCQRVRGDPAAVGRRSVRRTSERRFSAARSSTLRWTRHVPAKIRVPAEVIAGKESLSRCPGPSSRLAKQGPTLGPIASPLSSIQYLYSHLRTQPQLFAGAGVEECDHLMAHRLQRDAIYVAATEAVRDALWLRSLLAELGFSRPKPPSFISVS